MADDKAKDDKAEKKEKAPERRRLLCTRLNASHCISGVAFASVTLDDERLHVSEHVEDDAAYDRFLSMDGYRQWEGDEKKHARTIEDGLAQSRRIDAEGKPGPGARAEQDRVRELDEQRAANRNLAARIQALTEENAALVAENQKQREQIQSLEAKGLRLVPKETGAAAAA